VRIVEVRATALSAPWERMFGDEVPVSLSRPAASHSVFPRKGQASVLIEIVGDDGSVGVGECYGLPDPGPSLQIVERLLAPALVGESVMAIEYLWTRMMTMPRGMGMSRGFLMQAISGVDIALWDLKAKSLGLPLGSLLGGDISASVPCYASPVPYLETTEESQAHAQRFIDRGYSAIKLKVGRGVSTDVAHVAAVRDAIGPDVRLMLDCNCAYRVREAIQLARALRDLDIFWLEEPVVADDHAGLLEVRRNASMAIATGENDFSVGGLRDTIVNRAADVIMPNVTRTGGLTGALKIAAFAEGHGLEIAPHGVGSIVGLAASLHLMSAIPNGLVYEYNQLPNPLRDELAPLPEWRDGSLVIPTGLGLGVQLDPDQVSSYSLDRYAPDTY